MLFQNYLWDFDGTLFDTYPHITHSLLKALKRFGIEENELEVMRELKKSVTEAVTLYAGKYGLGYQELRANYDEIENGTPEVAVLPYPGAAGFLECVRRLEGRHYLYTHRNGTALRFLKQNNFEGYFSGMVTALDGFPRKPAPDAIRHLLRTFDLVPKETVMVGDRDLDLDAAKNAGISGILFDPEGFYANYKAEYKVNTMKELLFLCCGNELKKAGKKREGEDG